MQALVHALLPVVMIAGVVLLCALGKMTDTEALTVMSAAAGFGAVTIAKKDKPGP